MKKIAMMLFASTLVFTGCSGSDTQALGVDEKGSNKVVKNSDATEELTATPKVSSDELLKQVSYYQPKKKVEKSPEIHKKGQKIVSKIASKKKIKLTSKNLKDRKYRDFVLGTATDLEGLSKEEIKIISKYAKYIDSYENTLKNKDLKAYAKKLKAGKKLTAAELSEFKSLLPISKGNKLEVGKKKVPKKKLPKKNIPQPDKEQSQQNPETQPPQNPDNNEETGNGNSNEENNNTNGGSVAGSIGDVAGGSPDGNNNENEAGNENGNETPENNTNTTGGNNDGGESNSGNASGGNNDEEGSNNGNTSGGDEEEEPTPEPSNSYDPKKAKEYALKWWDKRNNKEYGYYSKVSGGCYDCWYDCTNFVSQAIQAGGIKEQHYGGTYWYYSDKKPSYAWGLANSFYNHFITRTKQVQSMWDLEVGDVVNVDFDHDGDIEHSAVVTRVDALGVYITQHTSDKKNAPLIKWFDAGYDVYGWKMKTTNNDVN